MKYQVGSYCIDTTGYRVTRGDAVIPVEPKVFDLLVYLIRHRDRVLTREALFEAVWDGREVSDATLSNHIASARKALGDSGELQQTIQTVRGRGYRFVAPVTEGADDAKPVLPARSVVGWRPGPMLLLGMVALLGTLVLLGWRFLDRPDAPPAPLRPYVLTVPFGVSANATEDHKAFADQLTLDVIDNLRKISGLRTVPQSSVHQFRTDKTPEHVLEVLPKIQYMLDGDISVAPDGTLRITSRLTDVHSDLDVWSKPFTVRIDKQDFFETTAEIAKAVAATLKVEILRNERRALAEFPLNPKAYAPYVAGWREMEQYTPESMHRAVALFERAIELDPDFLAAYLARSEALRTLFAGFEPPYLLLPKVQASLEEVLRRDPDSAKALSSLGLTQVMAWQWKEAWSNLSRAKALDSSLASTELGFALYYAGLGEKAKARQAVAQAEELDPLNAELADWGNWALFIAGEHEASRLWSEKQMRQHPDNAIVFCDAGVSAYLRGRTAEGVVVLEKCVELGDRAPITLIMLAQGYGYDGQKEKVLPLLEEAHRPDIYSCPYESAAAYLSLGDEASRAKAVELLYEAVDKRSNCLIFLRNDPRMHVLRDDARHAQSYADLLKRVGLDDEAVRSYEK